MAASKPQSSASASAQASTPLPEGARNLNEPAVYVDALVQAALVNSVEELAVWLSGNPRVADDPMAKWYFHFAERLRDLAPRLDQGLQARPQRNVATPKVGRNDPCPCGSGRKFKSCHIGQEGAVAWKLGSPTPAIRAMSVVQLIHRLPVEKLDQVPVEKASALALTEMATVYQQNGQIDKGLALLRRVLDGDRDDANMLYDYWIARYAEWLVEAGRDQEAEEFLMDEFDQPRAVQAWQVAQKLAAFYIDRGDPDGGQTWVETALEGAPDNPFNHYLKGLMLHSTLAYDEAVESYEQARELSGKFRQHEEAFLLQLVDEGLERARNHRPVEDEEEGEAGDEDDEASRFLEGTEPKA